MIWTVYPTSIIPSVFRCQELISFSFFFPFPLSHDIKPHPLLPLLSRAVVIATHWLAERSAGFHWTWLTSRDRVNEATWQRGLMIRFIIVSGRRFRAPGGESTSAEGFVVGVVVVVGGGGANVPDWSTSSNWVPWQREGRNTSSNRFS